MRTLGRFLGVFALLFLVHLATVIAFLPASLRFANEAVLPFLFLVSGWVGATAAGWLPFLNGDGSFPRFWAIFGVTAVSSVLLAQLGLRFSSLPQSQAAAAGLALNLAHLLITTAAVMAFRQPARQVRRDALLCTAAIGVALLATQTLPGIDRWFASHGSFNPAVRAAVEGGRSVALHYLQATADGRETKPLPLVDGKGSIAPESIRGAAITCPEIRLLTPPPAAKIAVHCEANLPAGPAPVSPLNVVVERKDSGWVVLGIE